jgi:hypothetical protein
VVLYVEFIELPGVTVHPGERERLAQLVPLALVGIDVDASREQECFVQSVQPLLDDLRASLGIEVGLHSRLLFLPNLKHRRRLIGPLACGGLNAQWARSV